MTLFSSQCRSYFIYRLFLAYIYSKHLPLQAVSNEIVMVMTWLAMSLMPIGDSMSLIYTCPIFVIILSFICFGQKQGLYKFIIAFISIIGAVFTVNPSILPHSDNSNT